MHDDTVPTALIIGASRGLGLALAEEHLRRGWRVVATVRSTSAELERHAAAHPGRLELERLDMKDAAQVVALRERLEGRRLDLLLVNAAITNGDEPVGVVSTGTFSDVMVTNALSPMRVIEALGDLVAPDGTTAVMSSTQGSIASNDRAGYEVYRASKSALNQLMRSYAVRHRDDPRTLMLLCPGWVRTELGGPDAALSVEESVPALVDVVERHRHDGGLQFRNLRDEVVPW